MATALDAGISRNTLYTMLDEGIVERMSRGIYRLTDLEPPSQPDLVTVASRIPSGVICLISALAFHDLTTQIPSEVHVALKRGTETPRLDYPPTRYFRFSKASYDKDIEVHDIDGVPTRIYSAEKTVADCFKFRNKIGMDVAIEALRFWLGRKNRKIEHLLDCARVCRVETVLRPYLEAQL